MSHMHKLIQRSFNLLAGQHKIALTDNALILATPDNRSSTVQ